MLVVSILIRVNLRQIETSRQARMLALLLP